MERKITKNCYEKKSSLLEIKNISGLGKFCGYASIFNVEDSYNDVVLPKAFSKTLQTKSNIKLLWQHQADKPIGYFNIIKEDNIGLYVEGQILLDLKQGKEAYDLIKSKAVNGLSIGYKVNDFEYDQNTRKLKDIELFEISIVTFPANKYSNITYCKSLNMEDIILSKLELLKNKLLNLN